MVDQKDENVAELSDTALADLELRQQPFNPLPAENEGFLDNVADAQLSDIKQALISGDNLLLVLGPQGSGKSTLLNQLSINSGPRIQCFSVRGSQRFSTHNLFAGMLEAFKQESPDDLKQILDDLVPCLQGMRDGNTIGSVILDDANLVPEAELTKLLSGMLYLNGVEEPLLRVTLAAPTEFEVRIPELLPEGADLPYSSLAIDAFDKDRSAAYLDYRFQQAGLTSGFPFNDNEIAEINAEAGGRPGDLHTVAAHRLNIRDENYAVELPPELAGSKKAASAGFMGKFGASKLLIGAAALLMIFAGLFLLKPSGETVPDDRYTSNDTQNRSTEQEAAKRAALVERQNAEKLAALAAEKEIAAQQQAANVALGEASDSDALNGITNQDTAASDEEAKAAAQLRAKQESDAAKAAAEKAEADRLAAEQAEKAAAEEAQKQAEAKQLADEQAAREKAEQERIAKEEAEAEALAEQQAAQAAATAVALNNLESPNWILVQNPAMFTVQMSASTDRASVEAFLTRNALEAPNSIFSFNRDGVTWYALVHGLYESIAEARAEVERLPESARSNQPWIRAIGRIQRAVKDE